MRAVPHNHEFRLRYRQTCKKAGYSQPQFAEKSGLSISTLKAMKQGTMSRPTQDLVVQTLNESGKFKVKITAEWLFEKWQPRTGDSGTTDAVSSSIHFRQAIVPPNQRSLFAKETPNVPRKDVLIARGSALPDLLTPGESTQNVVTLYSPHVGAELAATLAKLSKDAISSVERGDFEAQTSTGLTILRTAKDFPEISGVGEYLAGEGLRLQADLESDAHKTALLHEESAIRYRRASVLLPNDPRPVRGLARIAERNQRFDEAEVGFSHAEGLVLLNKFKPGSTLSRSALDHEHLRVARHKIHCLLDIRESNRNSKWNRENRYHELYGLVVQCDNLHNDLMVGFKGQQRWWQIEWFMGLVFLAKAWGHVKQSDQTLLSLLHALAIRRQMFSNPSSLSEVERSNIEWWIQVALSARAILTNRFVASVENLQATLLQTEGATTLNAIDDLVRFILPPADRTS